MTMEDDIRRARGEVIRALAADELAALEREENRQAYIRLPGYLLAAAVVIFVTLAYGVPLVWGWF